MNFQSFIEKVKKIMNLLDIIIINNILYNKQIIFNIFKNIIIFNLEKTYII